MKAAIPVDQEGIDPARIYPLRVFMRLSGFGQHAMRSARKTGLPVVYVGNLAFVRGIDFSTWLSAKAEGHHRRSEQDEPEGGAPCLN